MKGNSLLLEYTISFYIISLFITVVNPDLIDEANQRPQIILRDGSMVFQSAVGKNIHFESNGGQVFLNQANLLELAQTVTAAANTINSLHAGVLSDFESRLRLLETTVLGSLGVENRVSQLEQTISNGTSGADLPGNIGAKIKTLNAKVVRLTQVISKIRTTLSTNECSSNPCRNGGTCEDQYNGFLCRCPPNWEGTLCDVDVNECAQFAGTDLGCQNGATCINRIGTYECQCAPGFVGLHCTRKDKGCSKNNPQELCGHGICINQEGVSDGYTCLCDQGWTKSPNSKACTQDVDECTSGRPACSKNPPVSCINLPGTFHCGPCPQGYTGNGFYCVDIDECQINNGGCSMNPSVQCINTQGSRVCGACPPGYQGDGVTCTYLGACRINNGGCHPLAQCLENSAISQSYVQCICPSGYAGSGIGPSGCIPTAVAPISGGSNICQPNPCIHGTCIVAGTSFICRCYSGYTGATCGNAVNPCDSNPCQNSGTCVPQGNGYYCRCSPFTTGMHCEQQQMSCGGRLRSPSGTLKFPPSNEGINYPSQVSCGWLIVTNSTQVLNVTFKSFNLEESPECSFDWLQIHDGHSSAYQLIGRYCGSRIPNAIISTHNVLYLWFRSDRSNQRDGFELTWTSITPICGGDIVFQSHGSLSSPGYPGKYPTNRDCEWRLTAPNRKRIVLHFYTMNIESHSNCSFDFVEIRDGYDNRMVKKFCNTSLPEPLTTPSRRAVIRFHSDGEGRDTGFQISYSTAPSTDCGGVLTSGSGLIVPPLDPDSNKYLHRATCEWVIQLPEGERIKIEFLKLNLENHRSCIFDRVEVHEGRGPSSRLVGRYCGNQLPRPYTSLGHIVTIIFLTDSSVALEGFKIKYEEVCGGIFGEEAGHITSPMYPSKYTRNKNCIYEIQQPLGKSITLNFFDFTLEAKSRYSSRCYDFVEIRDGHDEKAPLLGQYCGTQFPPTIVSTYNYLWLKFHTDSSREFKGFYANYTTEDVSCGGIIRNQEGTIQTPRYPNFYPNNHMCRWVIVADAGNVINLNWINFNLEGETGMFGDACSFDYVEVYENVTEGQPGVRVGNRRYCGNMSPPNMTSTSNIVTIVFRTDYSIRFTGFIARYLLTDASNLCSANFVSSTGTILSPGYPSSYPHNVDCTWTISVPSGQQILLNVSDFWLERHSNCMWDYLEIRNGILASSPLIGRYCGREISTPIPSISNHLYLRFKTDYSHSLRGFNITWDGTITGCGGTLTGKSGHIVSPYYPHEYSINTECFYKISTSQGSIVQVIFLDFDLEYSRRCLYDYLAFYDGVDSTGKLLGKYCSNSHPLLIRSNSNNMFIKFKSDSSHHGRGFSIKYDTVCEVTLSGFGGVIESPNFPNRYPSNLNCKWTIAVKNGNYINVTFSHFMLERSEHCEHDYLQIAEGSTNDIIMTPHGKLCGSTVPQPLTSSSNKMVIEMKTDDSMQFSGFRLEWHLHGCGAHITDQSGEITSPNYPHGYADNIECEWLITTALDKSIELTIHDFDIEGSGNCNFDVLRVYGGQDTTSPALHPGLCHKLTQEMKLTSSGSNMLLTFTADSSYSGRGFKLSYKSVDSVCGGYFVAPSGYIHSHNFPNNYDPHDDCLWYIEVEKNHVVQLSFLTFDLEMSNNCTYDYVKVFDGNSTESPEIATLCGNVLPNITSYRSTGNTMVLRMKADGSLNGPGFSANYTTACGARIVTEDYGTISLANAINANRENQNCSWVIIGAQPQDRVTLTITHMDLSPRYENFGDVCEYGYLEVYDGEDKSSSPLGPFCGSSAPPPIISQGSALLLHLVSMYGAHYGYFSASYSVIQGACGGNFTSEHGAFSSPEYPNTYSINSECVWTISTSPGNRVTVGFRAFELEQSDNCNKDYLEVRANSAEGNLIGVYCQDLPSNITASQTLWIKFHSDSDGTARGFLADYSLIHGNELEGQSGQIASPLYPRPYLQESEYSWRVTVAVGSAIRITFREFYIESFSDSCDMFLAIYDGYDDTAPELMKKCGTMVPDPITSSSNMVYIYMSSMGVRHGSLFFLEWLQVERTPVPRPTPLRNLTCGGMIYLGNHTSNSSVSEYILTSPGYPYGYRHGLRCEWIIQTPQLYHPVILFTAMDLERNTRCTVDYVSVYSATDQSGEWKLLNTLCQTNATLTPPIDAYNMMKVVFRTDYSVNRTGFAAKVYPACGGSVKMPNGVIEVDNTTSGSSQNYYMECQWNITVRSGRTIKVAFDRFYIRNDRSDIAQCGDLYLKIQNGHYADSPSLGQPKYCGTELPVIPESTSNHISITYKNIRGGQGFKLRFFEESVSCGGSYTLSRFDNSMEISSPGFPNSPLPHIECIWTFMAPGGEALQVDFDPIFDFQSSKDCEADYVELRDGGTQNSRLINRFCIRPPSTQRSTQNMIWIKFFTNTYDHPSRFKANVSIARCGGIIRNWRGDIRSPGYPRQYPSNTQCTWRIEVVHYSSITIGFQDVDLPISTPCNSSDYVSVSEYNPFLQTTRLVNTVCGQNPPEPIQVASMTALIDFKSFGAQPDRYKGFSLNFSSTYENCGGELTAPSGEIKNPDYPSGTRYRSCTWTIIVPKSRRVTVDLVTVDMDLAERYSSDISFFNYQYSYFIDSLWRNRTLRRVESSSNIMKVYFYIRTNRPVRFLMRYSSDQPAACGGVLQGPNGSFPYPVISGSSFFCMWEYNSESSINGTLALTFRNVTIGRNSNFYSCRYSGSKIKVTSADEKQILYSTCGNYTKPQTIVSPFSKTKIIIAMSRVAMTYEGQYSISPCGGVLTGPEENVTSPGYPNNYPPNVHCAWAVTFPEELRITIKFNAMQLEETCSNDYLLIYNGPLPTSPLIDRFCGSHLREDIISQGNTLWIEFHSNGDSQFKGFSLSLSSLSSGCGGVIHNKDRAILSPNYPSQYPPNMECEWEIRADEGYFIQLRFVDRFQLEDSDNCDNDFVEIYDYYDSSYVSIKKVCGREVHRVMTSTGTRMKIRFKSNQNIQGDGFKIQWTPQCGGVIENVTEGHIVSPSYPREYGMNLDCNYTVKMPGHWMRAEFDTFELEGQGGTCRYDNVTIVGPPRWSSIMTLGPYCGTNKPPPFVSSNYFSLIFKTDFSVSRSGFLVRFKSITSCGGPINEPGALSSPDTYVEFYHVQINCTWTITAPANSVVVVRFSSFQLPSFCDPSMNGFGLTIYDGPFVNQRYRMATYCGNLDKSPPVIKSTGNKMVLEYLTYSFSSRSNSFNADVLFTYGESAGCGGRRNITSQVQSIHSPDVNSDGRYEPDLDCHWVLRAPPNQIIRLMINNLHLKSCNATTQPTNDCGCDYIEIRDGGTQYDELIGVYCGDRLYRPIMSTSSQLWVRFVTDSYQEDTGFYIDAMAQPRVCSEPLLNVSSSVKFLTSQNYPNNYSPSTRCRWILNAPRKYYRIAIHIEDLNITGDADCTNSRLQITDETANDVVTTEQGDTVVVYGQSQSRRPSHFGYASMIPVSSYSLCGDVRNFNFYSLTGMVSVTFVSNEIASRGFNLSYSLAGCNRNYTSPQGRVLITGPVTNRCVMLIEADQNATISLYFKESITNNCETGGLEVRDGGSADSPRLARVCSTTVPNPVFSTGNILRLETSSNHFHIDATYTTTTQGRGCGGTIFNYGGIFTSPLYPSNYRNASVCEWTIVVPVGNLAALQFQEFQIGPRSTCETDYVELISVEMPANEEGAQTRYCGDDNPAMFVSASNKLILRYTTSLHNAGTGWIALFMATVPGQRLDDLSQLSGYHFNQIE